MGTCQCRDCQYYWGNQKCRAFLGGIPAQILEGRHNHRMPYKGDDGIRYKPKPRRNRKNKNV